MRIPGVQQLKMIALFLLLLVLSGCWSQLNFDQLTVVSAIGLDLSKDKQLEVTIQLINPTLPIAAGGGNQNRKPFAIYTASGATLEEAVASIRHQAKKNLFFPQTKIVIIGEALARYGLDGFMDYFWRETNQNFNSRILITKMTAKEALQNSYELEAVSADQWKSFLKDDQRSAASGSVEMYEFLPRLNLVGFHAVAPGLSAAPRSSAKIMEIREAAVFRNHKMLGWLTQEESQTVNWLSGGTRYGALRVMRSGKEVIDFEIEDIRVRLIPVFEGELPKLKVLFKGVVLLKTSTIELDLSQLETFAELKQDVNSHIQATIQKTVAKVYKTYQSDVIGFGEVIHRRNPKQWNALKSGWNEALKDVEVEVTASVKIVKSGLLQDSSKGKDDTE
ncbi:Ger(x)C family spore germination protein [Paenibacillus sp. y28]|uniref:Ger(x)C family spore germination protein n=1 Tax=Paenibacillus sp. y28 TaxID=3129110 RepID=UPI003019C56D